MTTIAYDGRYLAADGRMTCGNIITGHQAKKLHPVTIFLRGEEQEAVVSGSGSYADIMSAVEWFKQGFDPVSFDAEQVRPMLEKGEVDLLLLTRSGELYGVDSSLQIMPMEYPYSSGSGMPFSMMGMRLGMNAVQSVYEAMKHDCGTGGKVACFDTEIWDFIDPDTVWKE